MFGQWSSVTKSTSLKFKHISAIFLPIFVSLYISACDPEASLGGKGRRVWPFIRPTVTWSVARKPWCFGRLSGFRLLDWKVRGCILSYHVPIPKGQGFKGSFLPDCSKYCLSCCKMNSCTIQQHEWVRDFGEHGGCSKVCSVKPCLTIHYCDQQLWTIPMLQQY